MTRGSADTSFMHFACPAPPSLCSVHSPVSRCSHELRELKVALTVITNVASRLLTSCAFIGLASAPQVGIRARASLVQAVTQKAFRLNSVRADQAASIVNFVASDIQKIYDGALVSYLRCYYVCTKPVRSSTFLAAQRGLHVAYQLHQTWYFPFTSNNSWHSSLPSR